MSYPDRILLAHGAGGRLTQELTRSAFLPAFDNPLLAPLSDSALLPAIDGRPAFTTDAFVVDPILFPGGDIGSLAVNGTVNDLAVAGAEPRWLSLALILEEGLDGTLLETVVESARRAADEAGVQIVAGDTKVVPRGKADGIFAITSGVGVVPRGRELGDERIRPGDALFASGPLGDHGAVIMAQRHGLDGVELRSDCASLADLIGSLFAAGVDVRSMHDPTRGGAATVCNEAADRAGVQLILEEEQIPVRPQTAAVCDLLGLDPLYLACEGRVLVWVAGDDAERALAALRAHPVGAEAQRIGTVAARENGRAPVSLRTRLGVDRPLDVLSGLDLPRIC